VRSDSLGIFWYDAPIVKEAKPPPPKKVAPERTWEAEDYLPGLAEAQAFNVPLYTFEDMLRSQGEQLLFDIECYENYFLAAFMSYKTGYVTYFEKKNDEPLDIPALKWVVDNFELITFNGYGYDMCILALALAGRSNAELKDATNQIIQYANRPQDILRAYKVKTIRPNHIDLIEVAPLRASLKIYGGRLHVPKMQDLPFPHQYRLSAEQIAIVRWYCVNDLHSTAYLRASLQEELELRNTLSTEYMMDLRSRSDAQIAEHVIADEVSGLNGQRAQKPTIAIGTEYCYNVPAFIRYQTPVMNWALDVVRSAQFIVDETGSVGMPVELKELKITIGEATYRMGIGGLHSSESNVAHHADQYTILEDRDVTSYYPQIILNQGLYPAHLGPNFLKVYRGLVNRRIAAKRAGQSVVAESLKITVNGSFGKLGSQYSILYAPDLLIQVTVTGQLALLMLIEALEVLGITVVSANTDGIVIKCPTYRRAEMLQAIVDWEYNTEFETEGTNYKSIYCKDVNNYIAVLEKPKKGLFTKTKGAYSPTGLKKNPTNQIVTDAVEALLVRGVPVDSTIRECRDIRKFVQVRTVKGGAVKNGEYLGKAIRWYYAEGEEGDIIYASNGHSVPRSTGARPLMTLPPQFPTDIHYQRYIDEAHDMLKDLAYVSDKNCSMEQSRIAA
jgi:hypothetical protein